MKIKNIIIFASLVFGAKKVFYKADKKTPPPPPNFKPKVEKLKKAFKIVDKNPYLKDFILNKCEQQLYDNVQSKRNNK